MTRSALSTLAVLLPLAAMAIPGCARNHYRLRADADAYGRLVEKSTCKPWELPGNFSVYPAPHSRLYDSTCVNDPRLPSPSPQLYAYELPALPERDTSRFRPRKQSDSLLDLDIPDTADPPVTPSEPDLELNSAEDQQALGNAPIRQQRQEGQIASRSNHPTRLPDSREVPVQPVSHQPGRSSLQQNELVAFSLDESPGLTGQGVPTPGSDTTEPFLDTATLGDDEQPSVTATNGEDVEESPENSDEPAEVQANQVPLPRSYWESIPEECLARMFEFESVRAEYERTYGSAPEESRLDDSPKLALEDIIDLTLLNSRDLQTEKETLYRVALALTLERFDYQLKPSVGNNGSEVDYSHSRSGGITSDSLRIPTTFQLEKMMYSGADFIGRFANDVLLTFNGPQGFAADVGSELLFDFSQSLLQRDVRLEALTQAERDVVYAARDFTRFRRELFVQQANDYYSLIRQFRQIEIQCQNYFTLAREFNQRSVEIKYGFAARTQLDQVEQQVINGRQSILSACTSLENALDDLKLQMGIPTEQPLNIDLSELNLITLSDELAVNAELIERTRRRVDDGIQSSERSPTLIVAGVSDLAGHMLDSLRLRKSLGDDSIDANPLERQLLELRIEEVEIEAAEIEADLDKLLSGEEGDPSGVAVFLRRRGIVEELSEKVLWQLRLMQLDEINQPEVPVWTELYRGLGDRLFVLGQGFLMISQRDSDDESRDDSDDLEDAERRLVADAESLQNDMQALADELDNLLERTAARDYSEFESRAVEYANELLVESEGFRAGSGGGLVPIEMEMDDAMMTALVQRFDLMNQRGFLADDWRQIKYAADDLRSVLNLSASQSIRTRNGENRPFDFTFDDSTTSARLTLDLPFNRRAQRNSFRTSLFDYQRTLRNVVQLEDNIKLGVRRDLRTLKLDRQQYTNDVAGAALALERVKGTEAEVRLGQATSRDFLESQQAYVQAISGVASDHINYIVGRLGLFLDLESLSVGDDGFWDELYDENHQPTPYYQLPEYARPGYGRLHPRLKYSQRIRRMQCVPDGVSMIHKRDADDQPVTGEEEAMETPPLDISSEEYAR